MSTSPRLSSIDRTGYTAATGVYQWSSSTEKLCLSVIITNYNYAMFLQEAIDSATHQTYSNVEVIVVDDGSTDHSRDIIAAAGSRIVPVLKENGGQASAFNAGFLRSTGDIVIFLDADDVLLPNTGERVVAALRDHPNASQLHYPLEVIDANGTLTGRIIPRTPLTSSHRRVVSPTSGNAFWRRTLASLMPMPEECYRICADGYLVKLAPLLGPVVSLEAFGARYRVHGNNNYYFEEGIFSERSLSRSRNRLLARRAGRHHERRLSRELNLPLPPRQSDKSILDAIDRLVSLRLDPERHPVKNDTTWRTARDGAVAALPSAGSSLFKWCRGLLLASWVAIAAVSPRWLAQMLIRQLLYPDTRVSLVRLIAGSLRAKAVEGRQTSAPL